jgi:hypothetical protein
VLYVLFDVHARVFAEVRSVQDLSGGLLGLLAVDDRQLMHLLEVFAKDLSLEGGHASQEAGGVACPDFTLFHLHSV